MYIEYRACGRRFKAKVNAVQVASILGIAKLVSDRLLGNLANGVTKT